MKLSPKRTTLPPTPASSGPPAPAQPEVARGTAAAPGHTIETRAIRPGRAPAERAGSIRDELDVLERHHPGLRARVLGAMPGELVRQVLDGTRGDWCSLEASGWLCDIVVQQLGEQAASTHWRRGTAEHLDRPVLRAFAAGVRTLFGGRPDRLVELIPKAWVLMFRDACEIRAEHGEGQAPFLILEDLAPAIRSRPSFLLNWRSRFEGLAELLDEGARVEWIESPGRRRVEVRFAFTSE